MLCLECGAEMSLVQVVKDTTMFVPGYEHQTWQCSGCSTLEQRMTFTHEGTSTPTVSVELTQTVSAEPTHPEPTALQTNTWAKSLEKLRRFEERAMAAKEAARETERRAQFNRDWDNLRSVPPPSASSEVLRDVTPDEPLRSATDGAITAAFGHGGVSPSRRKPTT